MADARLADTQWVEILPPAAPAPVSLWVWLAVAVGCALLLALAWRYWQRRPRQRALRQLRWCEKQLQRRDAAHRDIALQIYQAVQLAWQAPPTLHLHASDVHWQDYYRRLMQSVFAAQPADAAQLREVLRETRRWLRSRA